MSYSRRDRTARDWLCRTCSSIDFKKYLFRWKNSLITLGTWEWLSEHSNCRFCRLIVASIRNRDESCPGPSAADKIKIGNIQSWFSCVATAEFDWPRSAQYSNRWDLGQEARITGSKFAHRVQVVWDKIGIDDTPGEIHYLPSDSHGKEPHFHGRMVYPESINWSAIQSWLWKCGKYHGVGCREARQLARRLPLNLRVIDLNQDRIVEAPYKCEYVALTYIWGENMMEFPMPKTTRDDVCRNGAGPPYISLPNRLPKTIANAMLVARRLGYEYMWVDSLCIIQDDDQDRHGQIQRMDAVYNCAALTIAAGSGLHADCGLPGGGVPRFHRQIFEVIKGIDLQYPFRRSIALYPAISLGYTLAAGLFKSGYFPGGFSCSPTIRFTSDVRMRCGARMFLWSITGSQPAFAGDQTRSSGHLNVLLAN